MLTYNNDNIYYMYSFLKWANPLSTKHREWPGTCIIYSIEVWRRVRTRHAKYPSTNWFLFWPESNNNNLDQEIKIIFISHRLLHRHHLHRHQHQHHHYYHHYFLYRHRCRRRHNQHTSIIIHFKITVICYDHLWFALLLSR